MVSLKFKNLNEVDAAHVFFNAVPYVKSMNA